LDSLDVTLSLIQKGVALVPWMLVFR